MGRITIGSRSKLLFFIPFLLKWLGCLLLGFLNLRSAAADEGSLSLVVAVPLTGNNGTATLDPGFFHLAAAKLAMEHFNDRNPIVVPQLENLEDGCNLRFDPQRVLAVDTGTDSNRALDYVLQQLIDVPNATKFAPNAIAGPYNTIPALELSVLATGLKVPLVAHRAVQDTLLQPNLDYFNQVSANLEAEMRFLGAYLQHMGRTDYVALLYNRAVLPKVDLLRQILEQQHGMQHVKAFGFDRHGGSNGLSEETSSILLKIKATGYRTIVLLPELMELDVEEIGKACTKAGVDQGEHFWIISGGGEHRDAEQLLGLLEKAQQVGALFLRGAAYVAPYDGNELQERINFRAYLRKQDTSFFRRVLDFLPKNLFYEDYGARQTLARLLATQQSPLDALAMETRSWAAGAGFMYDAVMAVALGACQATKNMTRNSTVPTGPEHLAGIRSLDFVGATGKIQFAPDGNRLAELVPFVSINFVRADAVGPNGTTHPRRNESDSAFVIRLSESYVQGKWIRDNPGPKFIYADGTFNPPMPLQEEPEQNYISPIFRVFGLILFGVALVTVLWSILWVWKNQNHSVVIAGQPPLLYTLCFASLMVTFTILIGAFDESWGFSQAGMDAACRCYVWLIALGRTIAYGALFTKLYRVNCLLRYKTSNIPTWRILWPFCAALVAVLAFLTTWQIKGDYEWKRIVVDEVSGESVGACTGELKYT